MLSIFVQNINLKKPTKKAVSAIVFKTKIIYNTNGEMSPNRYLGVCLNKIRS